VPVTVERFKDVHFRINLCVCVCARVRAHEREGGRGAVIYNWHFDVM
jgi:hypothetical protein